MLNSFIFIDFKALPSISYHKIYKSKLLLLKFEIISSILIIFTLIRSNKKATYSIIDNSSSESIICWGRVTCKDLLINKLSIVLK